MSQPAARIGDMTAHGGVIVMGTPTVLIGNMPAAKVSDMHVCPLITVLVPHVGGPVLPPGSPTVLIGGMPAARMGDMATCVGPPDTIVLGCMTVLIGASGSGSGGAGGGAAQTASYAAHAALAGTPGPQVEGPHWIEYQFVDKAGNPLSGIDYEFTHVSGNIEAGVITADGKLRRGMLPDAGNCNVKLFSVVNAKWSTEQAKVGETLELTAEAVGFANGTNATLEIWERDISGPDNIIATLEAKVDGEKIKCNWECVYHEEAQSGSNGDHHVYSAPTYYFIAKIARCSVRSPFLNIVDDVAITLKNGRDEPIANEPFRVILGSGEIREGRLDSQGRATIENVSIGEWDLEFGNIQRAFEVDGDND